MVVARGEPQSQCWPLLVGGSLSSSGLSSLSRPRTCDRLLCLSCNLSVISVQNMAWTPDTDYMFLRYRENKTSTSVDATEQLKAAYVFLSLC